jgi:tetratricopeptide (TPR) repeat protein
MAMRICLWIVAATAAVPALADFEADLRAAGSLCQEKKHEAAIAAYVRLARGCSDPLERCQAASAAAVCARVHLGSEARALDLCREARDEPYVKACRATVYQWAVSPARVVAELRDEDISAWPESLAAIGYAVRGQAYFNVKDGPAAARDFVRAFQFARSFAKWSALQRLGDTYWKLLDDDLLAEACYRKCMSDFGGGWPGLQARVNLGELLLAQGRHDAAIQCLSGAPNLGGYWKAALLMGTAKVHIAAGHKPEAIAALKESLAIAGLHAAQKKECERLLATLR